MFDPLNRLLRRIQLFEAERDDDKGSFVFLGDYIDYGPSSRQVLDTLLALRETAPCIFLAGNHEDLMLQMLKKDELYRRFGNVWFRGNGGQETVASLATDPAIARRALSPLAEQNIKPEDVCISPEHMAFFNELTYAHTQTFVRDDRTLTFAFCHGLLHSRTAEGTTRNRVPAEDQLALKTYEDFHRFRREQGLWIEDLHVWNRTATGKPYGDFILVHGHTPTVLLRNFFPDIGEYDPKSGLPYLHLAEPKPEVSAPNPDTLRVDAPFDRITAIDIDTGAVYGKCLTALLLDADLLLRENVIHAFQIRMDRPHRNGQDLRFLTLEFTPPDTSPEPEASAR